MKKQMHRLRDTELERLNFRLMVITVSAALLYLAVCVWQALKGSSGAENFTAPLSVNPRSIILLCGIAAALGVAFMPEIGKILAALALFAVVALFGYWGYATAVIKANLGNAAFEQAGLDGSWFIGATLFDYGTLLSVVLLMAYDVWVIRRNLQARLKEEKALHTDDESLHNGTHALAAK